MKKILLIEDDAAIAIGLQASLKSEHYEVRHIADGAKGFQVAATEGFDVILLDVMLPNKNGYDICRELRAKLIRTPILMLTSKSDETDKVLGLEFGADDYLTKPFSIRELHARIKALLRRTETPQTPPATLENYSFADNTLSFSKQEAFRHGKAVKVSTKEFEILKFFIAHEGEVVSRDRLLSEVWGYHVFPTTRTVDNYILSLRKKLEDDPAEPKHFITVHTTGYKFIK
jgi:DNA-binding response OmpR family regulator